MTISRRRFTYIASGLLIGGGTGFFAWQQNAPPIPALDALREAAKVASGIHQIGLGIIELDDFSVENAERTLLARMDLEQEAIIHASEFLERLDKAIKTDYANHDTVEVNKYILSNTEVLFISYSLIQQKLDGTAYIEPTPELNKGVISKKVNFGPQITVVGQIFNEQPDGHGGIWVQAENTPPGTVIAINGNPIRTRWQARSLTGAVYNEDLQELIARPAKHQVSLMVPTTGTYQILGQLTVLPRPPAALLEDGKPSNSFCEITKWSTFVVNGVERINVDTLCASRNTSIYFDDIALNTSISPTNIRALLDRQALPSGEHLIRLVDSLNGETVILGNLTINREPGTQ